MKKQDSLEALSGYYESIDKLEAPDSDMCPSRSRISKLFGLEVIRVAVACAIGVGISCFFATPGAAPRIESSTGRGYWGIEEQLVKNGIEPEELLQIDMKRSQREGKRCEG